MLKDVHTFLTEDDVLTDCTDDYKHLYLLVDDSWNTKIDPKFKAFCEKYEKIILAIIKQGDFELRQSETDINNGWQKWLFEHYDPETWSQSPYSYSFYDSKDIDWGHKPEGSLRLSDHWNFESGLEKHCITDNPEFKNGWAVGKYHKGVYHIVKYFN